MIESAFVHTPNLPASLNASSCVDDLVPVEEDLDVIADHLRREIMPDTGRDLAVPTIEADPFALDDVVQVHVVLEALARVI